ncbi:TIGR00282 family metallophosphoesterase [Spiroplasma endosymbiont of Stenodema calcarata]|uniref:TIGR00282 family metallophosphoesterase n=1 Tax=Spiroplasma endosymbiont of Stenodema calcarata TaxID=3139328 RepID=UPI003CCB6BA5
MKILMIGDIYGKNGRIAVNKYLPVLVKRYKLDLVIANGENTTHGKSISKHHYNELKSYGINIITSGNHIFRNAEVLNYIEDVNDLLKPANMNSFTPGAGTVVIKLNNKKIRITNLIGRSFMDPVDNPYTIFEEIITNDDSALHFVDFHAEASAEKLAFAWNYDGNITAFFGTHTHVQTADNRLLPKGTAYITDVGMCGSYNSIIGANPKEVIIKEKTGLPVRFEPAENDNQLIFSAALLEVDDKTNKAIKIERILIRPENEIDFLK